MYLHYTYSENIPGGGYENIETQCYKNQNF